MKRKETILTGKDLAYAKMRGLWHAAVEIRKLGRKLGDINMAISAEHIMNDARNIGDIIAAAEANGWDR